MSQHLIKKQNTRELFAVPVAHYSRANEAFRYHRHDHHSSPPALLPPTQHYSLSQDYIRVTQDLERLEFGVGVGVEVERIGLTVNCHPRQLTLDDRQV
jgi:hypothetical protein